MWKKCAAIAAAVVMATGSVQARELNVVTSFTVLADMVHQIGGDKVQVRSLVGPNGDPHVYQPTPADVETLSHADLLVISGLGLEGWMERLTSSSGFKGKVVVASDGIEARTMIDDDDGPTKGKRITDPHAWNSAANGAVYAENIARALETADPDDAAGIKTSGANYVQQLRELDSWARRELAAIPQEKRKVITSHDAFSYLGAAYGVTFLAPQGVSSDAEATPSRVAALIRQIRAEKVKAVFIENQTDPRLVRQVAKESGAKLGGELYPEALSKADGPAATYVDMFRYNIGTLKTGMLEQ